MIDFHSHILPAFDDGSESLSMSMKMLQSAGRQGITHLISTSHCYPTTPESVDRFIYARDRALSLVQSEAKKSKQPVPKILSGCELNLRVDFRDFPQLDALCIEGTNYLMIEMPYGKWEEWMFDCLYSLSVRGFRLIIAHIDRYQGHSHDSLNRLFEIVPVYQVNTEAFLNHQTRRHLLSLFEQNHAHILGSDMHNMTTRASQYAAAVAAIYSKFSPEYAEYLDKNGRAILQNQDIDFSAYNALPLIRGLKAFFL